MENHSNDNLKVNHSVKKMNHEEKLKMYDIDKRTAKLAIMPRSLGTEWQNGVRMSPNAEIRTSMP